MSQASSENSLLKNIDTIKVLGTVEVGTEKEMNCLKEKAMNWKDTNSLRLTQWPSTKGGEY